MFAKLKMIGGVVLGILFFIFTAGIYRAGKRSERLDQEETNNEAQRIVTKEVADGNEQYQEKVDEARNTTARRGRFTE